MKRVAVLATASCSGATTFARKLASGRGLPYVELDALFWRPNWTETPADEFRALVAPIVATDEWVIDGSYQGKLGDLVLRSADLVVWLDLPMRVWLPRLVRRTVRRVIRKEELWGTNRETLRNAFFSRDSLLLWTLQNYGRRRRSYPRRFAAYNTLRLRSPKEIEVFLKGVRPAT